VYGALVLLALIMLGLAAGELYRVLQKWRRLRAPGAVELVGRVVSEETLQAPLAGEPCVFYRLEISRYGSAAGTQGSYSVVHEERRGGSFRLEADSGEALVVGPEGGDDGAIELLDPAARSHAMVGSTDDPSPAVVALLEARGFALTRANGDPYDYSIVEERLVPEQRVHALGRVEVEGAERQLRRGDPQHPLLFAPGPLVKVFRRRVGEALVLALGGVALLAFALSRLPGA
jgi:hypothetical protein